MAALVTATVTVTLINAENKVKRKESTQVRMGKERGCRKSMIKKNVGDDNDADDDSGKIFVIKQHNKGY